MILLQKKFDKLLDSSLVVVTLRIVAAGVVKSLIMEQIDLLLLELLSMYSGRAFLLVSVFAAGTSSGWI